MPSVAALDVYYSKGAYYRDKQPDQEEFREFSVELARGRYRLVKRFAPTGVSNLLDIGAGNAALGIAILQSGDAVTYDIVEPAPNVRELPKSGVNAAYHWLHEVPKKKYQIVTLNQVLEHVSQPLQFLKAVKSVMKVNGLLYIDVPRRDDFYKPDVEPHVLFWDENTLRLALEKTGFKVLFLQAAGLNLTAARRLFSLDNPAGRFSVNTDRLRSILNRFLRLIRFPVRFKISVLRQAENYGGDRQWLRCIAQNGK